MPRFIVRMEIDGIGTRFALGQNNDDVMTENIDEAQRFNSPMKADAVAGKMGRMIRDLRLGLESDAFVDVSP